MRIRHALLSSVAIPLILAVPAFAQQPRSAAADRQLNRQDISFVKDAAEGGLAEVELGKLAQQNAQDDQVKRFGARMVQDHGSANSELAALASGKGMAVPQQLGAKHVQLRDRLARLRGAEFDRAYMREMVKDHDADMKAFRREAQTGTDPDIKSFAQKTLTVIEQHDKLAHDATSSLTASGSSHRPH